MAPAISRTTESHEAVQRRSYNLLAEARNIARDAHKDYPTWHSPRELISNELTRLCPHLVPYDWQLDVGEALALGLDCSVIAGTGAGKTLPFIMPILADPSGKKMVLVISPLNILEEDQAQRFRCMGVTAAAVNAETYTPKLAKDLLERKHRCILTSAEMSLQHPGFSKLLRSPEVLKDLAAVIVDEAHCISQWGEGFRPVYSQLGKLRSLLGPKVPFLVTSATLPPVILAEVWATLEFSRIRTFHLNLGNNRPNIAFSMRRMTAGASDLAALDFLTDVAREKGKLERSFVFVNSVQLTMKVARHLKSQLPQSMRQKVAVFHAKRSPRAKRKVMRDFRKGRIDVLCTTEAAGMGADIPDVDHVVQFMVPSSLSIWMQRAGRAGRAGQQARATLLVEKSVFQVVGWKLSGEHVPEDEGSEGDDDEESDETEVQHRKKVEDVLREWVETLTCRREVADIHFDNPVAHEGLPGLCCDNCASPGLMHGFPQRGAKFESEGSAASDLGAAADVNRSRRRAAVTRKGPGAGARRGAQKGGRLHNCRKALEDWRVQCWLEHYSDCCWGPTHLLPDKVLTMLARDASMRTFEDLLVHLGGQWPFVHEHGQVVLDLLDKVDANFLNADKENKQLKKAAKRQETAVRKMEQDALAQRYHASRLSTPRRLPLSDLGTGQPAVYWSPLPTTPISNTLGPWVPAATPSPQQIPPWWGTYLTPPTQPPTHHATFPPMPPYIFYATPTRQG